MRDENCIFCKIAAGDIPSYTLCEDEDFRAILDLGPASRGHALILPKDHYRDLTQLPDETAAKVLPVGTAYAVWTGIGAVGAVVLGVVVYHEPVSVLRMVFLFLIIAGIVGLNLTSH